MKRRRSVVSSSLASVSLTSLAVVFSTDTGHHHHPSQIFQDFPRQSTTFHRLCFCNLCSLILPQHTILGIVIQRHCAVAKAIRRSKYTRDSPNMSWVGSSFLSEADSSEPHVNGATTCHHEPSRKRTASSVSFHPVAQHFQHKDNDKDEVDSTEPALVPLHAAGTLTSSVAETLTCSRTSAVPALAASTSLSSSSSSHRHVP